VSCLLRTADVGCSAGSGWFRVSTAGSLTVGSTFNCSVHAFDVDIQHGVSVGQTLQISSCVGRNMVLGGANGAATNSLLLDGVELALISAARLRMQAQSANLTVLAVTGAQSTLIGRVSLYASEHLDVEAPASFPSLDATGVLGCSVNDSLTTTVGDLNLHGGAYGVNNAGATRLLSSANTLAVFGPGAASVVAPAIWQAKGDVVLSAAVHVLGRFDLQVQADSNADGSGALLTNGLQVRSSSVTAVTLTAADFSIGAAVDASTAALTLDTSGASGSIFTLGANVAGTCSVDQTELNDLLTHGVLQLGGNATSRFVVHGASYSGTASTVNLLALHSTSSQLVVDGSASQVTAPLINIEAKAGVNISAALTLNGRTMIDGTRLCCCVCASLT